MRYQYNRRSFPSSSSKVLLKVLLARLRRRKRNTIAGGGSCRTCFGSSPRHRLPPEASVLGVSTGFPRRNRFYFLEGDDAGAEADGFEVGFAEAFYNG